MCLVPLSCSRLSSLYSCVCAISSHYVLFDLIRCCLSLSLFSHICSTLSPFSLRFLPFPSCSCCVSASVCWGANQVCEATRRQGRDHGTIRQVIQLKESISCVRFDFWYDVECVLELMRRLLDCSACCLVHYSFTFSICAVKHINSKTWVTTKG